MSHFFSYLSRMKLIKRWALMRSTQDENIQEHSLQVAMVAHALALIKNKKFDGALNPERIALQALYHDASEVITGDLPTPVKYFNSDIKQAYKKIEKQAEQKLIQLLPEEFRSEYESILAPSEEGHEKLIKDADNICAYLKCVEEEVAGNKEFTQARTMILNKIMEDQTPEVEYFMKTYVDSFKMSLDEMSRS